MLWPARLFEQNSVCRDVGTAKRRFFFSCSRQSGVRSTSSSRLRNFSSPHPMSRRVRKLEKSHYELRHIHQTVRSSLCAHGKTRFPLDEFSWNFVFEGFWKMLRGNSSFIKIWQEWWLLYVKTYTYLQGDQKVSVHLMFTIQKVTSNVQSVPRQSPDIYWH
jgi:hypothetical protein